MINLKMKIDPTDQKQAAAMAAFFTVLSGGEPSEMTSPVVAMTPKKTRASRKKAEPEKEETVAKPAEETAAEPAEETAAEPAEETTGITLDSLRDKVSKHSNDPELKNQMRAKLKELGGAAKTVQLQEQYYAEFNAYLDELADAV